MLNKNLICYVVKTTIIYKTNVYQIRKFTHFKLMINKRITFKLLYDGLISNIEKIYYYRFTYFLYILYDYHMKKYFVLIITG